MTQQSVSPFDQLVAQYLGLEELAVTEAVLDLCGASLDVRALPLLKKRLHEEERRAPALEARGYVRMREKCEQLVTCLKQLVEALEGMGHGTINDSLETQHCWLAEIYATESSDHQTAS